MSAVEKPQCHLCGSKRQRNLTLRWISKKGHILPANPVTLLTSAVVKAAGYSKLWTCDRCRMLGDQGISKDDIKYSSDWYFGKPRYRYHSQKQINDTHHWK